MVHSPTLDHLVQLVEYPLQDWARRPLLDVPGRLEHRPHLVAVRRHLDQVLAVLEHLVLQDHQVLVGLEALVLESADRNQAYLLTFLSIFNDTLILLG